MNELDECKSKDGPVYQQMKSQHIEQAAQLCSDEGWNVDAKLLRGYHKDSPCASIIVLLNEQVIGLCCACVTSDDCAFICYFIVHKEHRGKGIGGKLLAKTVQGLGNRNVLVYSTTDGRKVYTERGGFKGSHRPAAFYASMFVPRIADKNDPAPRVNVAALQKEDLFDISNYDKTIHIIDRRRMIVQYIEDKDYGITARNGQGKVCGFAFVEKKPRATKVTPLYADSTPIAKKLLKYIVSELPENEKIQVYFPGENQEAVDFWLSLGFSFDNCLHCQLLWTKTRYEICLNKVYSMMNLCNVFA